MGMSSLHYGELEQLTVMQIKLLRERVEELVKAKEKAYNAKVNQTP